MTFTQLLQNPRFRPVFLVFMVFTVFFFVVNVLVIGGRASYELINDVVPAVLAGLVAFQIYRIWSASADQPNARRVWPYLLAGLVVWTLGDVIWAYYEIVLHIAAPYPSWADALWVVGYFLLFIGLYSQLRIYNIRPTRQIWENIALVELVFIVLSGYFVVIPMLQSFDATKLPESILNVLYPLLDLILFPLAFLILTTLEEGRLAVSWRLITLGFMIRAISDLIFSYITWQDIYLAGGGINLVTSLYDFVYAMSYPVLGLGFVAYRILIAQVTPVLDDPERTPQAPWNHIFVSTDRSNRIISYSPNFLVLLGRTEDMPGIKGGLLYALLGLEEDSLKTFVTELAQRGFVEAMLVKVSNASGGDAQARLSALAIYDAHKMFSGVNMVIATPVPLGFDGQLSTESQGVIRDILSKTGNLQRETREALNYYFNAQMRMLDNLVHQYGGRTISRSMRMVINETALKSGWQIRKEGLDFVFPDQMDLLALVGCMSGLLTAARAYAVDMVGLQLVNVQVGSINAQIHPDVMRTVEGYSLRLEGS
jgi:hypothetical protein